MLFNRRYRRRFRGRPKYIVSYRSRRAQLNRRTSTLHGGAIDVAVLTKIDGFRYIQSKSLRGERSNVSS
jgi:hypothetical protein